MDLFPFDFPHFIRVIQNFSIPDKDAGRIVKFCQIRLPAVEDLQDGKCGIGNLPHFAYRKRSGNGFHTGFYGSPFPEHSAQYF